jgi:hypothetical protein
MQLIFFKRVSIVSSGIIFLLVLLYALFSFRLFGSTSESYSYSVAPLLQSMELGSWNHSTFFDLSEGRQYWFIDKSDLYAPHNVAFSVTSPRVEYPKGTSSVLNVGEAKWEGTFSHYPNAVYDPETKKYFLYYRCFTRDFNHAAPFLTQEEHAKTIQTTCVASSEDGIHYIRPMLSFFMLDGSYTNIIHRGATAHNFFVFIDESGLAGTKRYMAIGGVDGVRDADSGIYLFGSNDGFKFNLLRETPILTKEHDSHSGFGSNYDSMNTVSWLPYERKYIVWLRRNEPVVGKSLRQVQYAMFEDLVSGSPEDVVKVGLGNDDYEYYLCCVKREFLPGVTTVFTARPITYEYYENHLYLSRDGKSFSKPLGEIEYLADPFEGTRGAKTHENFLYRQACSVGLVPSPDGKRWIFYHIFFRHLYDTPRAYGEIVAAILGYSVPKWGITRVFAQDGHFISQKMRIESESLRDLGSPLHAVTSTLVDNALGEIRFEMFTVCSTGSENEGLMLVWAADWIVRSNESTTVRSDRNITLPDCIAKSSKHVYLYWRIYLQNAVLSAFWVG